jgi:hypothetical protein
MMIEQSRDDSMQETAEAIAQLATATASDRGTVATLTITNAKLANKLEADHALIAQLKSEIATLKIKIKPVWQGQYGQEPQTTTVTAGPMDTKSLNRTPVLRATSENLGIKKQRRKSIPWEAYNGAKNDAEGQLRTKMIN